MSLDTSISNVGEYYSSHYLSSFFAKDIKSLVSEWKEQGSSAIPARLKKLSQLYFKEKALAIEEPDMEKRINLAGFHAHLLEALGYMDRKPLDMPVEGGTFFVPAVMQMARYSKPWMVACETGFCLPDSSLADGIPSEDPLSSTPLQSQLCDKDLPLCPGDWERLVGKVFTTEDSPRWILLMAGSQILLLDKHTWAQGRYLAFDLDDAFGRNEKTTFDHLAAFLSKQTLCPSGESDDVLHDTLEEQSHKFAHGVTDTLQISVRQAIELLANEWVMFRREKNLPYTRLGTKEKPFPDGSTTITAEILKREALIYVYRLLFCFYAEARGGELGILPINDDVYKLGYSLESLRDLENIPLTPATEKGTYFHQHLRILFRIIHEGFHPIEHRDTKKDTFEFDFGHSDTFSISPLTATLFDPDSLYLLDKAVFSNLCLQKVIKCLSLSTGERTREIGRVNYAELGINQLGAVYEGLLSFKGMFADKDLIQVKPASKKWLDKKTPTWFVDAQRIEEFKKDEIEYIHQKPRIYPQGSFILHLSGIDREQSASYYTPEVLTRCLVEEALRELLKDYQPADADKILILKICEPAMGSGAFLNEATRQMAQKYLELKQEEIKQRIEPGRFQDELRRVQHYIATRNVYGVDLNATAVELGALSLWLGSIHRLLIREGENGQPDIHQPGSTPWFGLRLRCGNSLIGAGRRVWTTEQLKKGKHFGAKSAVPRRLKPGEKRKDNEIYHFLVFDEDMVPTHKDPLMKKFDLGACDTAKDWVAKEVKSKWDQEDIARAIEISELIDHHWALYSEERQAALEMTACNATVWPTPASSRQALEKGPSLKEQETIKAELESSSGSFQRLKLIMDTWCSFFFWPLDQTDKLPRRTGFLESARILLGDKPPAQNLLSFLSTVFDFDIRQLFDAAKEEVPDTEVISGIVSWYGVGKEIAVEQNFHHWELIFTEVLGPNTERDGFDLVVGNPPWLQIRWKESSVLSEIEPMIGIKSIPNSDIQKYRLSVLNSIGVKKFYFSALNGCLGNLSFLNSNRFYFNLKGIPANTYKNFIANSWNIASPRGIVGLVHEEGVFDDPGGGFFRLCCYKRLKIRFKFRNELQLFPDVGHAKPFSLNIYFGSEDDEINFKMICNLFHPSTIEGSLSHKNQYEPIPGIKDESGKWQKKGHKNRILNIGVNELKVFSELLESDIDDFKKTRLPELHSSRLISVLKSLLKVKTHLSDYSNEYIDTAMFEEKMSVNRKIISKNNSPSFIPNKIDEWIISGPHFYIASPFNKTPRTHCTSKGAYDQIDLLNIKENYIPKANFKPGSPKGDLREYNKTIPTFVSEDNEKKRVTDYYRHINRVRVIASNERTLIGALIPPGPTHIDGCITLSFRDDRKLLLFHGYSVSICCDFITKICGTTHCRDDVLRLMPMPESKYSNAIISRVLRLSCLSNDYSNLWNNYFTENMLEDEWSRTENRLKNDFELAWGNLQLANWCWKNPLRTNYARRLALIEIDTLVALSLSLNLEDLLTIYNVQFPVMKLYEKNDQYDQQGSRIPNTIRKDAGATQFRDALKDWDGKSPLTVSWEIDNGHQTVTKTFYPPFEGVDREKDYEIAYNEFKRRYQDKAQT